MSVSGARVHQGLGAIPDHDPELEGNESLRLFDGQAPMDRYLCGRSLVATWQRREAARRARGQQPQPDIVLHRCVELLDGQQAPADPALVSAKLLCDRPLTQTLLSMQGPHQPPLLQGGQRAPRGKLEHQDRGCLL
jgi:hypothetical protein